MCRKSQQMFQGRASKAGNKNALLFRDEAIGRAENGRLRRPLPLNGPRSNTLIRPECNISRRFGLNRSDKIRTCDDLRFPKTNQSCAVRTPTKPVQRGQIAEICRSIRNKSRDCGFPMADPASAYKQLPIEPDRAKYAAAALKSRKMGNCMVFCQSPCCSDQLHPWSITMCSVALYARSQIARSASL